jgi:hypothetical protein
MNYNPLIPVRKDKFHRLANRLEGRFLKHPASGMHGGRKYFLKKPKRPDHHEIPVYLIHRMNP